MAIICFVCVRSPISQFCEIVFRVVEEGRGLRVCVENIRYQIAE